MDYLAQYEYEEIGVEQRRVQVIASGNRYVGSRCPVRTLPDVALVETNRTPGVVGGDDEVGQGTDQRAHAHYEGAKAYPLPLVACSGVIA